MLRMLLIYQAVIRKRKASGCTRPTTQSLRACNIGSSIPISIPSTAGEGGAWGMAVLAAFMLRIDTAQTLADYLDTRLSGRIGEPIRPDPGDVAGFEEFFARHARGLAIERAAVEALR